MPGDTPQPLTPAGCDLRDFPRMSIDIPRLFASTFNASASRQPLAWMVGFKLWCRAWHQVPAASLPGADEELCHLAELGLDTKAFRKARALAMHGWVMCTDGRFYHPVIAEHALSSWLEKLNQRLSGGTGNASRWGTPFDAAPVQADIDDAIRRLSALNPQAKAISRTVKRASQRDAKANAK